MNAVNIISLGAGVQSSTMALMAAHGEITPMPVAAVFADTQAEPRVVYEWLEYLTPLLPFPVHTVTVGNIANDFIAALRDPRERAGQPPFMVWNHRKEQGARLWRKCTTEYKKAPVKRKSRELMQKSGGKSVVQWIGISMDEAHRMKPSDVNYIEHRYPLCDMRLTRSDCLLWMERNGYKQPPKSACWLCPYTDNRRWRDMRDNRPNEWSKAVAYDHAMRRVQGAAVNGAKLTGTLYLHRDCVPLDEVDLSTAEDRGQFDMFCEECEGMCGV